jgi:predicted exporter
MKRRRLRIALGVLVTALGLFFGSRVRLDGDIGRLLPDRDPALRQASAVLQSVMQRMVIDLSLPEAGADRLELLMRAADELATRMAESLRVHEARARMLDGDAIESTDFLVDSAARILRPEHYAELEGRLEPEALDAMLAKLRRRAHEPDAAWFLQQARRDPFGISGFVLAPMEGLLAGFRDVRLVDGHLVTQDGAHLLVFVEPSIPATDIDGARALLADLQAAGAALRARPELAGLVVRHLGAHRSTLDNQDQIASDVALTSTVGAVFVALIAILTLARFWWGLLALTPALFGGAVALGVVSFFRDTIAAPVVGFGVALLGISIDYAIHVLYRLNAGHASRLPVRALFMGATTTAFAFLALCASSMPALREVGLLGALGIVASSVFAVYVLPAIAGLPAESNRPRFDLRALLVRRPVQARTRLRWAFAAVALTPLFVLGALRLELDGEVQHLSSLSKTAAADERGILETWGEAFRTTQVLVPANEMQGALAATELIAETLVSAREAGEIRDFACISDLLPTLQQQALRLAAWRAFWSGERVARLRADLARATDAQGFEAAAFEPFFEWIAREPAPLEYALGDEGPLATLVSDRVLALDEGVLVATPVFVDDWQALGRLKQRLAEHVPSAVVLNNEELSRQLAALVGGELWKLGSLAFLAVAVLVLLWLRSWRHAALVMLPLVFSSLWTLGALGWMGVPVNLANSVFAAFLFGIAVDYAIFMTQARIAQARGEDEDLAETDASVLLCATTTCVGFGVLVIAGHPVLNSIGATALTGILAAFAATRVFVPALSGRWLAGGRA